MTTYYRAEGVRTLEDRAFRTYEEAARVSQKVRVAHHCELSDSDLLCAHGLLDIDTTDENDADLALRLIRLLAGM